MKMKKIFILFWRICLCLQGVADSVQAQDDDAMLKCLIDLAENSPKFLRGQVENILNLCSKVPVKISWSRLLSHYGNR